MQRAHLASVIGHGSWVGRISAFERSPQAFH